MPKNAPAGKRFDVYLNEETHDQLTYYAEKYGISRSELVRNGVMTWLTAMKAAESHMELVAIPTNVCERLRQANLVGYQILPNILVKDK